jgi:transcriptional regulator with XRE-family HTH domain
MAATEASNYLSTIKPILNVGEIADFTGVTRGAVYYWENGHSVPRNETSRKLGELAACVRFLDKETGFSPEESRLYLMEVRLDSVSYEPYSMLDKLNAGEAPVVLQKAIELSIVDQPG